MHWGLHNLIVKNILNAVLHAVALFIIVQIYVFVLDLDLDLVWVYLVFMSVCCYCCCCNNKIIIQKNGTQEPWPKVRDYVMMMKTSSKDSNFKNLCWFRKFFVYEMLTCLWIITSTKGGRHTVCLVVFSQSFNCLFIFTLMFTKYSCVFCIHHKVFHWLKRSTIMVSVFNITKLLAHANAVHLYSAQFLINKTVVNL